MVRPPLDHLGLVPSWPPQSAALADRPFRAFPGARCPREPTTARFGHNILINCIRASHSRVLQEADVQMVPEVVSPVWLLWWVLSCPGQLQVSCSAEWSASEAGRTLLTPTAGSPPPDREATTAVQASSTCTPNEQPVIALSGTFPPKKWKTCQEGGFACSEALARDAVRCERGGSWSSFGGIRDRAGRHRGDRPA